MNTVNNPSCIRVGVQKLDSHRDLLMIYSPLKDFLGSVELSRLNSSQTVQVDGPVARKGFGKVLMEAALMHVTQQGYMLASVRDGDNRPELSKQFKRIYQGDYGGKRTPLPECQNLEIEDFTNAEDDPALFFGYKLEPSNTFLKIKVDISEPENAVFFEHMKEKYKEVFFVSYDTGSTQWIDEDYPLNRHFENAYLKTNKTEQASEMSY